MGERREENRWTSVFFFFLRQHLDLSTSTKILIPFSFSLFLFLAHLSHKHTNKHTKNSHRQGLQRPPLRRRLPPAPPRPGGRQRAEPGHPRHARYDDADDHAVAQARGRPGGAQHGGGGPREGGLLEHRRARGAGLWSFFFFFFFFERKENDGLRKKPRGPPDSSSSSFFSTPFSSNKNNNNKQIREIRESIELPLLNPELFERVGIKPPKGVLLYGPPGTGKTLLARAIAANMDANFLKVVASAIVDKYIGESARLIREMFGYARDHQPCIIFMDEVKWFLK